MRNAGESVLKCAARHHTAHRCVPKNAVVLSEPTPAATRKFTDLPASDTFRGRTYTVQRNARSFNAVQVLVAVRGILCVFKEASEIDQRTMAATDSYQTGIPSERKNRACRHHVTSQQTTGAKAALAVMLKIKILLTTIASCQCKDERACARVHQKDKTHKPSL